MSTNRRTWQDGRARIETPCLTVTRTQQRETARPRPPDRYLFAHANKLADTMNSRPVLAIAAVVIAVVGVLQLTSQPDGFSVTIGVCALLVAILNAGKAVLAFRRRESRKVLGRSHGGA
jgi:hypothetical protein